MTSGQIVGIFCVSLAIIWAILGILSLTNQLKKKDYYEYENITFSHEIDRAIGIGLGILVLVLGIVTIILIIKY